MKSLNQQINGIVRSLLNGQVGEANRLWNQVLPVLSLTIQSWDQTEQLHLLPALRAVLSAQETQDWVAMADALLYQLKPGLVRD